MASALFLADGSFVVVLLYSNCFRSAPRHIVEEVEATMDDLMSFLLQSIIAVFIIEEKNISLASFNSSCNTPMRVR